MLKLAYSVTFLSILEELDNEFFTYNHIVHT